MSVFDLVRFKVEYWRIAGKSKYGHRLDNLWIFGEWFGEKICDNSMYLANYVAENHDEIELVWVCNAGTDHSALNPKIRVVDRKSKEAQDLQKCAGAAFMNQGFIDFNEKGYNYLEGAVSVNLWHGIPWKKIGCDAERFKDLFSLYWRINARTQYARYWLCPSSRLQKIMGSAHYVSIDRTITTGYPRNSIFYNRSLIAAARSSVLKKAGLSENAKIITYMPTFRDKKSEVKSFESVVTKEFEEYLVKNNIYIIQKSHYVNNKRSGVAKENINRIVYLNDVSAVELLAATDLLITDYSSCFFDFLLLNRPIVHYLYDYEYFSRKDRGLYYKAEEVVCGDIAYNEKQLIETVIDNLSNTDKRKALREKRLSEYLNYESADSCEYIYKYVKNKLRKEG